MTLVLLTILVLLLSAFFSGSEMAYISASKIGVELKKNSGSQKGKILSSFYDKQDQFLGVMLVGNNLMLVLFTILMKDLADPFISRLFSSPIVLLLLHTLLSTLVVLIFGEFLPKTLFRLYSNKLLFFFTYPLLLCKYLFSVPAWIMTKISNFLLKYILKIPVTPKTKVFTKLDLEDFINVKIKGGEDEMEADIFKNALHLQSVKIRECMVPRTEIQHIDKKESIEEYVEMFKKTRLSRLIVSDGDIDNIMGYVHHHSFLQEPKKIADVIMDIPFVPEVMNVQELLLSFMREKKSIACVVDEFGGISGIITIEDMVEEIFGEIEDEFDEGEHVELKLNESEYLFSGRHEVDYLNEKYEDIKLPTSSDYTTLSGYLVMTTETIPEEGAEILLDGYKFILSQVSEKKIDTVRLIVLEAED